MKEEYKIKHSDRFISTREIADDLTTISSTRWAFASIVKADILVTIIVILAGLVGHFIGKPIDNSFYGSVAMLLGITTGIITTSKALQGFETNKEDSSEPEYQKPEKPEKTQIPHHHRNPSFEGK